VSLFSPIFERMKLMSEKAKQAAATDDFDYMTGMMDAAPKMYKCETYLRLPAGVSLFNGKEDVCYRLLFFPWKAGKGNPAAIDGAGSPVINRFLHVHQNIGADNEWHLCPAKTMGKPCVVCQTKAEVYAASKGKRLSKDEFDKQIRPLNAKEREFWLVHELDGKPNNLQVWEESVHLFGNYLRKWTSTKPQFKGFANPNTGLVVEVTGTQKQIGTGTCVDWGSMIQFVQRSEEEQTLAKKLFAKVLTMCPDDWVVASSNERLKKTFLMLGNEEEETEEAPVEGEESSLEEEIAAEEEVPAPAPAPAPAPKPKPAAVKPKPKPASEEETTEEEEAPAPAPKPKPATPAGKPKPKPAPAPEPEAEEETETEEEEAPAPAPAPKPKPKPAAPAGKPKPKPAPEPEAEEEATEEEEVVEEESEDASEEEE